MAPTVDILIDPLTPEGYETIRKQVGKEAADNIALNAWRGVGLFRCIMQMVRDARGEIIEVWLDEPKGEDNA